MSMDDPILNNNREYTDREILLLLEAAVRQTIKEVKGMDRGVNILHDRIKAVEGYKQELITRDIVNKVENNTKFLEQMQWSYRTVAVISGGVGFAISMLVSYLPMVIKFIQQSAR